MSKLGFEAAEFGLHSLRSGGATAAANAGEPNRLFKLRESCRSSNTKDGHVKDSGKTSYKFPRIFVCIFTIKQPSLGALGASRAIAYQLWRHKPNIRKTGRYNGIACTGGRVVVRCGRCIF